MSLGISALGWIAIGTTAYQGYQANKASKDTKSAALDSERRAKQAATQADMDFNRANQKKVNTADMLRRQQVAGASTLLTGANGVDPSQYKLGASTLLGS